MRRIDRGRYIYQVEYIDDNVGSGHMDSHVDTCAGGPEFVLMDGTTTKLVEVSGFNKKMGPLRDIPIGTCATAYNNPKTGQTYIILFGEMLYFGKRLTHSLLCPNQIRNNGNITSLDVTN